MVNCYGNCDGQCCNHKCSGTVWCILSMAIVLAMFPVMDDDGCKPSVLSVIIVCVVVVVVVVVAYGHDDGCHD